MQDIKNILAGVEGLTEEQAEAITKGVTDNYRTISETQKKAEKIATLEQQVKELTEAAKAVEGSSAELEALKNKVAEYEQAEADRVAAAQEQQQRTLFESGFNSAVGERKFTNDVIKSAIFDKVYEACKTPGVGVAEALADATKDLEGVFVNPQQDVKKMPALSDVKGTSGSTDSQMREFAKKLFS